MTPIDLTKLNGRTADLSVKPYGNHFEIQEDIGEGKAFKVAVVYRGGLLNENSARDRAYLFAAAPDLLARARELEDEVERLKVPLSVTEQDYRMLMQTNNCIREMYEAAQSHSAKLAGCLEMIRDMNEYPDVYQSKVDDIARAALAAYNEAMGEGVE